MRDTRCMLEPIAERQHCSVLRGRNCSGYQLTIEPLPMRLPAHVVEELARSLRAAQLDGRAPSADSRLGARRRNCETNTELITGIQTYQQETGAMRPNPLSAVAALFLVAMAASTRNAMADENYFGYSYGAETLPKGAWEVYNWATWRHGKGQGDYKALDLQQEIEYGFTDKFQGSFYINERYHDIDGAAPLEEGENGSLEPEYPDRDQFAFQGVQAALKYNFLSPYTSPVGFSLYFEPGYSRVDKISGEIRDSFFTEVKFILQKNFLDDTLVTVANLTTEMEWENEEEDGKEEWETEFEFEVTGGLSYRFAPKWYAGAETRYHSEYPDFPNEGPEHHAVFLGPVLHYGAEKWWFTLTVLPQIYGTPQDEGRSGHLHLEEHEEVETRLKVGINF